MEKLAVRTGDDVTLHVGVHGDGPDVVVLSGGPGSGNYLEREDVLPRGLRAWFPEPRGVGRSGGGPHSMSQALADLEDVRRTAGVDQWLVLGHSWGSDLAVRYALECPAVVSGVIGVVGHGFHKDRTWSQAYEAGKDAEPCVDVDIVRNLDVWRSLNESFTDWIHRPDLFRSLADTRLPMVFVAAGDDPRPHWPLEQLARLVPRGHFTLVDEVPHDFWWTHNAIWQSVISQALDVIRVPAVEVPGSR